MALRVGAAERLDEEAGEHHNPARDVGTVEAGHRVEARGEQAHIGSEMPGRADWPTG